MRKTNLQFLPQRESWIRLALTGCLIAAVFVASPVHAAIQGTVVNATTGKPVPRIPVTLVKFGGAQGMAPVSELNTDAAGKFSFDEALLGLGSQPVHGMLRTELEGISYTKMIVPDVNLDDIRIEVFDIAEDRTLAPDMTAFLLEPGSSDMVINQFFQFTNRESPPITFSNADEGTLQFYLPPSSQGSVQVRATGPAGMPLPSSATKTNRQDVYKVDFPLKPGRNLIELTYHVSGADAENFTSRVLYDDIETRFVIPEGVRVEGGNFELIGQEPQSLASIYEHKGGSEFSLKISGVGQLADVPGSGGGGGGGDGNEISIAPAPLAAELWWVIAITAAILGVGFYNLLASKPTTAVAGVPGTMASAGGSSQSPGAAKRSSSKPGRKKR